MAGFNTSDDEMITGINVTPLVDISLVLLIIFMVTATVMMNPGVKVNLPKAATAQTIQHPTYALVLTKDNELYINGKKTTLDDAFMLLQHSVEKDQKTQVVIAADKDLKYQNVMKIIDLVRRAGVVDFALNVEVER